MNLSGSPLICTTSYRTFDWNAILLLLRPFDVCCLSSCSLLFDHCPITGIRFASSTQDVRKAISLNVQAYHLDASVTNNDLSNHALITDYEKQICSVVSVNGIPVSTATTILLDECLDVSLVATSAQHRQICSLKFSAFCTGKDVLLDYFHLVRIRRSCVT